MAAEKVTAVEMEKLTEAQDGPDAEKDNLDETKEEEEEEGAHVYYRLDNLTNNLASIPPSSTKQAEDVYKKVRLYKRIAAAFIILALILLAVVLALAIKRNRCSGYGKGWGRFEKSCFFKSEQRLSWQESRNACQRQGGDLVVIDNGRVQNFLTRNSKMLYWIGLRYSEEQQWMWINNTAPTQSYWSPRQNNPDPQGSCALLNGGTPEINNWFSNSCKVISHYICQRQ
ncbi:C-type lectin domain family 17, member A [Bagarius yarrelli]|uniref:C-type lectin domain family 17, member A n=1 Tax=Bagarius yarrelli TaxID=175774 RepID=A0A556V1P5_BAGYA|nr:C-type lectin domain family 17, member A [Bagarius yarrelli]